MRARSFVADATLGGARIDADGSIAPKPVAVAGAPAGYRVDLAPGSAALLTIP